jgi:uncharacterized repeat protein (TIGR03803 family)
LILSGNTLYGAAYNGGSSGAGTVFAVSTDGTAFTNLYSFKGGQYTSSGDYTNSDGASPKAGLILSGNTLYGTAVTGGSSGNGTVFKVNTDGTDFTNLHNFTAIDANIGTNRDGANPAASLILSGNTLYGTAQYGGVGAGTVFAVNTDGTGFATLHICQGGSDGAYLPAGLILSGNTLYGTVLQGGSSGNNGGVFSLSLGSAAAQAFTTLHSFTATDPDFGTFNSEGAFPYAGLVLSGNTLYGTAAQGGSSGIGTVFKVNTDGSGFTNLHTFTAISLHPTNSDGAYPNAELVLSGTTLYGTAAQGGSSGNGTVFKVNTDGTGFTNLHSFGALSPPYVGVNSDEAYPYAGLILSGNTLYGTASQGGSSGAGTVFAVNTDGTSFTNLYSFTATSAPLFINSDGADPMARLVLSGNTPYGTAPVGGSSGNGTVFRVNTAGKDFTNLYSFTATSGPLFTNSDGARPYPGLILAGNTLYGTALLGGNSGNGIVFAVNTAGTGFTNLHSFTALINSANSDGAEPAAGLVSSGNTLYGTARYGGSSSNGTVFAVNTDGTGFTTLHTFTPLIPLVGTLTSTNSDGANPQAGLVLSDNTLYGTAAYGGSSGAGTVFRLLLPPRLIIIRSAGNVILTWPNNAAGFTLQSTTNLVSPAVWSTVSPGPAVVNGENAVTNPISGTRKFYRLSQ